jgi:hypothetical protein
MQIKFVFYVDFYILRQYKPVRRGVEAVGAWCEKNRKKVEIL